MIGFVGGLASPPVLRIGPDYADFYFDTPGVYDFVIPEKARTIDLTVIGGGAGGQEGGLSYGNIANAFPAGGAGGGSGEMKHTQRVDVLPGTVYAVTVAKGGMPYGGAGGDSSFGTLLSAGGGRGGMVGANEPKTENGTANGGTGGLGGIGGNGGGAGKGNWSHTLGADGADGASTLDWKDWDDAQWYVFSDPATGKRLGTGGRGGNGYDISPYSSRKEVGKSAEELPGVMYGSGGRGGDQKKNGPNKTPSGGQGGLVAIRVWYKKR